MSVEEESESGGSGGGSESESGSGSDGGSGTDGEGYAYTNGKTRGVCGKDGTVCGITWWKFVVAYLIMLALVLEIKDFLVGEEEGEGEGEGDGGEGEGGSGEKEKVAAVREEGKLWEKEVEKVDEQDWLFQVWTDVVV